MILLIPLGGIGSRFAENGYKKPKALIHVMGKPILFWLLDNLDIPPSTTVYIPYNKMYSEYRFESLLRKEYPTINFLFFCLKENTRGAAETVYLSLCELDNSYKDQPILCLDSDNFYYKCDLIKQWAGLNSVVTFEDTQLSPVYSYVDVEKNIIHDIVEKEKISNIACCGAYGFDSWRHLQGKCKFVLDNNIQSKGEFYISTVIREMLKDNIVFHNKMVPIEKYVCLGTPIQIRLFCHNYPRLHSQNNECLIRPKRYCFDLDNTLVTFPKTPNDYSTVEPITKNIDFVRYLKRFGHTIILYTARRMKTHSGNVGKVLADIGRITFDTLAKFDIPYDEIYFGKPEANVYIDDLALNCFDDLERELGYYETMITPRDFNSIKLDTTQICTKESDDLEGEIYYYNNIPKTVKDMFPILFNHDPTTFKYYSVEKINGITASSLYLSCLMSKEELKHIMNSIYRLQNVPYTDYKNPDMNILSNYIPKMTDRYNYYDYSPFSNHLETFTSIKADLQSYRGKKCVIHGDAVFSNIIINQYGKIKFIDMRGKVADKLSICGDFLYDWAKIYQSLIGYDEIHLDKRINLKYKHEMISFFCDYLQELYGNDFDFHSLKTITKCLIFSLIPLHNNEKCMDYYSLISSSYL